jgi:hypothetical protein
VARQGSHLRHKTQGGLTTDTTTRGCLCGCSPRKSVQTASLSLARYARRITVCCLRPRDTHHPTPPSPRSANFNPPWVTLKSCWAGAV